MASQIDVVFNADTGRYVANVNAATGATEKSAQAVADAKNKILASMEAQIQKAQALGASQQKLQAIAERAASQMSSVTEQNANRILRNLDRILERNRQVAGELANLKVPKVEDHEGLSRKQAGSAVLRGGGLRAAENVFAGIVPEATLQMAGMAFGVTALAGVLFDLGEKGYEAFEKVRHATEQTRQAFDEVHSKAQIAIDDKEIENQKIQDQVDKLSGKPNNGLATALLEAKKMSDQLITSLQESRHQMDELFKQTSTGKFGSVLGFFNLGPKSTTGQEDNLRQDELDREKAAQDARDRYTKAFAAAKTDVDRKSATEKLNGDLGGIFDSNNNGIQSYQREISRLKKEQDDSGAEAKGHKNDAYLGAQFGMVSGGGGIAIDNSKRIAQLEGVVKNLQDQKQLTQLDTSIFQGSQTLGRLKQQNQLHKGDADAERKAMEEQRRQWQLDDDLIKQHGADVAALEVQAWQQRLAGLRAGTEQYIYAQTQLTERTEALQREDKEKAQAAFRAQREGWDKDHDAWVQAGQRSAQDEAAYWQQRTQWTLQGGENYLYALNKQTEAERAALREREAADKARNKAALEAGEEQTKAAEAMLKIRRMTGQVSPQDAAAQLANIHTEQYRQKLAALQAEFARQDALDPHSAATVDAQAAMEKAAAERAVQVQQDAAEMAAQSWQGALHNAMAEWVQDADNSARQVVQLWQQAFDGLNANLADLMVGDKSHFGQMFKGVGKTLAGDALKRVEAPVMQAFGIGKPDGSAANPLHVRVVGGGILPGSMGQGTLAQLGASMGGPSAGDDSGSAAPAATGILGALGRIFGIFGGGRAVGGGVNAGTTYLVGEAGPELFTPGATGAITPNHALGGGNVSYAIHVPNGVTPEAMHMYVASTLREYHPHVVRASVQAMQDHQARKPSASR